MANAKIISIIDHELEAARARTAGDIEVLRVESVHAIRDIGMLMVNLRRDFNLIAATVNQLRKAVTTLRQDLTSLEAELRQASVDQLKQKGGIPGGK